MRILISAGEASGDAYGAALVEEMRRQSSAPLDEVEGIGGPKMRAAGVRILVDSSGWGAVSIVNSLRVLPRIYFNYYGVKWRIGRGEPGFFVPIDFGYVNIRLARHAKNRGWRVMYFVPPGSWRHDRQGKDLPAITDAIATPFPWSAEILNRMGANAHWFGHPIKQLMRGAVRLPFAERKVVAILPGSREHEIHANLPPIADAVRDLDAPVEFALAPSTDAEAFRARWRALSGREHDTLTLGDTRAVLGRARAAIVCSGTATLEAALGRCPCVVVYAGTDAMRVEEKIIKTVAGWKRPRWIALPNILLERDVLPERVDRIDPVELRAVLETLRSDSPERAAQLAAFDELDTLLGPDDAITQAAGLALQTAGR